MNKQRIAKALSESVDALGWSKSKLGAVVGKSYFAALRWCNGTATPRGDTFQQLLELVPGFRERLARLSEVEAK